VNTLLKPLAVVIVLTAVLTTAASASWQLVPGKPYDGHIARRGFKEPCWSAATSKCSLEKSGGKWLPHGYAPDSDRKVSR